MAKKLKKFLKKAGKAALVAGALYAGAKGLGKRKLSKAVSGTDEAGRGVKWFDHPLDKIPRKDYTTVSPDFSLGASAAKGGRIGKKGGGRTGKQFGGGLNRPVGGGLGSTARRDMRSGYYPSDMGMRGGTMYKKGGRVKSMGAAKRGGGVAKK
jgi:hypothetical protein